MKFYQFVLSLGLVGFLNFAVSFAQEAGQKSARPGEPAEGALAGAVQEDAEPSVDEALPLPEWTPEDRRSLIVGRLVPGKALLGESKFDGVEAVAPASSEYDTDPSFQETNPREVASDYLPRYAARRAGQLIIDPQGLLSAQEYLDHEHFLGLQAAESAVKVQLVLFDREQTVPSKLNLPSLMEGVYRNDEWTVVVLYHLGAPKRSQIAFSRDLESISDNDHRIDLLRKAIGGSLRQSDPDSQLQSFMISLTNQLYWMEEKVREEQARREAIALASGPGQSGDLSFLAPTETDESESAPEDRMTLAKLAVQAARTAGWVGLIVLVLVLLGGMWLLYRRYKVYELPEFEFDHRLGAPHGGGVGPVLKFANPNLSPSAQRSEAMPDYLTRL